MDHPKDTSDLDVKISPRGSVTVKQIERFMHDLTTLDVEVIFMRKVGTFKGPLKPSIEVIDSDPPVLQAVYNKDLKQLTESTQQMDPKYIYRGKMHYKQIDKLIFYRASEWAICGHKFNQGYKGLSDEIKEILEKNPWSEEGKRYHHVLARNLHKGYLKMEEGWETDVDIDASESMEILANASRDIINIQNVEIREINPFTDWGEFVKHYYKPFPALNTLASGIGTCFETPKIGCLMRTSRFANEYEPNVGVKYDEPEDGLFQVHWLNGNLRYEWHYKDGKRADGVSTGWYETGELKQTMHWKNGIRHGLWVTYHKNGEERRVGTFTNGVLDEAGVINTPQTVDSPPSAS